MRDLVLLVAVHAVLVAAVVRTRRVAALAAVTITAAVTADPDLL